MWNIKLIKFPNGKFGVRTGLIFHSYVDMEDPQFSWRINHSLFSCCQTNESRAREIFALLKHGGEIIE